MLVVEVLEDLGYQAIEACDGAGGLKLLRSGARIDLLVTDVGLPGDLNGRQLADAGRVLRPSLKVLFITGYAEAAVLGHGSLDEDKHILTKPFSMDELASRIRGLLAPSIVKPKAHAIVSALVLEAIASLANTSARCCGPRGEMAITAQTSQTVATCVRSQRAALISDWLMT